MVLCCSVCMLWFVLVFSTNFCGILACWSGIWSGIGMVFFGIERYVSVFSVLTDGCRPSRKLVTKVSSVTNHR